MSLDLPATRFPKRLLLIALLLSACASVPFDYPREPSSHGGVVAEGTLPALAETWLAGHEEKTAVYPLALGGDAFDLRLDLIERAQATIDAQYFLIKPDAAGIGFAAALLRAADRGVKVRLLLDDIFTTVNDEGIALLDNHENIEVRLFNPLPRKGITSLNYVADFSRANRRMHNKSFTVDGNVTIVGGRNIAAEYFEMNPEVDFWDFELFLFGGLVAEVADSFDDFWNHKLSLPMAAFADRIDSDEVAALQRETRDYLATLAAGADDDGLVAQLVDRRLAPFFAEAHVISDHPDKLLNPVSPEFQSLASSLGSLISAAETEVIVYSPYFIPHDGIADGLVELAQRGVRVDILTNSLASTNHVPVHGVYKRYRKQLLEGGVRLYEVSAGAANPGADIITTLHTKAIMVDRRWLFVGSLNVDPRSIDINTEMGLVLDSPELAAALYQAAEKQVRETAYQVSLTPEGWLRWTAERDGEQIVLKKEPETSGWRRFKAGFYGMLPLEKQL